MEGLWGSELGGEDEGLDLDAELAAELAALQPISDAEILEAQNALKEKGSYTWTVSDFEASSPEGTEGIDSDAAGGANGLTAEKLAIEDDDSHSELWSKFLNRQSEKERALEVFEVSIAEAKQIAEQVQEADHSVEGHGGLRVTVSEVLGEDVAGEDGFEGFEALAQELKEVVSRRSIEVNSEMLDDRRKEILQAREERERQLKEEEVERLRLKAEAEKAREAERAKLEAEAEAKRAEQEKENQKLQELLELRRSDLEKKQQEKINALQEQAKKAQEEKEAQRKTAEAEAEALEKLRSQRQELKRQEEQKEAERARRSTQWHQELIKKQEEDRILVERKAQEEKKKRAEECQTASGVIKRLAKAKLPNFWLTSRRRSAVVLQSAVRRSVAASAYCEFRAQREAHRLAEEQRSELRITGSDPQLTNAPELQTVPDCILSKWAMRRRRLRRKQSFKAEESSSAQSSQLVNPRLTLAWASESSPGGLKAELLSLETAHTTWKGHPEARAETAQTIKASSDIKIKGAGKEVDEEVSNRQESDSLPPIMSVAGDNKKEFDFPAVGIALSNSLLMQAGAVPLDRIQRLELNVEEMTELPELAGCSNLVSISLNLNKISCLKDLKVAPQLEELSIRENCLDSLAPLAALKSLSSVCVDVNRLKSLEGLKELRHLRVLEAQNNSVSHLTPDTFQGCHSLERLVLYRNKIEVISGLDHSTRLKHLDLGRNEIAEVQGLGDLRMLETLILYENKITQFPSPKSSAREPHHLPLLRNMWLNGNRIERFGRLGFSPLLQHLQLSDNNIKTLSPLSLCGSLIHLDLSFNKIEELDSLLALRPCIRIQRLQLNDNPVSEQESYRPFVAALCPGLSDLDNAPLSPQDLEKLRGQHLSCDAGLLLPLLRSIPQLHSKLIVEATWGLSCNWQHLLKLARAKEWERGRDGTSEAAETGDGVTNGKDRADLAWRMASWRYLTRLQNRQRQQLGQKQKRELRQKELNGGLNSDSYAQTLKLKDSHAQQIHETLHRHNQQLKSFDGTQYREIFVRHKSYDRRVKAAKDRKQHGAAATIQAALRRLRVKWIGQQSATQLLQAQCRRSMQHLAVVTQRLAVQRLAAQFKTALLQAKQRELLSGGLSDDEDMDFLVPQVEDFWSKAPQDLDDLMAPDLEGGDFEDVGDLEAKAEEARARAAKDARTQASVPPTSTTGSHRPTGQQGLADEEALRLRIAAVSEELKVKKAAGGTRAELQPLVDTLLELRTAWTAAQTGNGAAAARMLRTEEEKAERLRGSNGEGDFHQGAQAWGDDEAGASTHRSDASVGVGLKGVKGLKGMKDDGELRLTQKTAQEIAKEWGFKDTKAAEMMLRKRLKYQKLEAASAKKQSQNSAEARLARFKRVAGPANGAAPKGESNTRAEEMRASADSDSRPDSGAREVSGPNPAYFNARGSESFSPGPQVGAPSDSRNPNRHVRSKFLQPARASVGLNLPMQDFLASNSGSTGDLRQFQTQALNQKLVRQASRGSSSGSLTGTAQRSPSNTLHRQASQGGRGAEERGSGAEGPVAEGLRVNNFFL